MIDSSEDFQYDSCSSSGICSISPRTSALQRVLVLYLKLIGKYAMLLVEKGERDKNAEEFILNTITLAISNPEFTEESFITTVAKFKEKLPLIIDKYNEIFEEEDFKEKGLETLELFQQTDDIVSAIKFGEREFRKVIEKIPSQTRDLYNIMLVIAKSISINLLDLESFGKEYHAGFLTILKLIGLINEEEKNLETLKDEIYNAAKIDNEIMKMVHESQEERYGKQGIAEVSYTTTPSKAVLVVGSNIRELETILEALKETDIDVYTHDDMMIAHTFPKFSEYKNLKGQYGQGVENCLLDFATFPGPIILTKHSLHNIENLYRGRLFTTDYTCPKGVIRINNNDFSEVIESANNSKGFKSGKQCESVIIGYDHEETSFNIKKILKNGNYDRVFLIGLERYSLEQKTYFERLIKLLPENIFVISFSYNFAKEHTIHINTCFDNFGIMRVFEEIKSLGLDTTVFVPKCDRNSISQMIYLSENTKTQVFVGKCTPIILNPSLMNTLQTVFSINSISSAKKDLDCILNRK